MCLFCSLSIQIQVDFTGNMCMAKYQYSATARSRSCEKALQCYETGDTTQMTFQYTATTDCSGSYGECSEFSDKAQGGQVWIVENTDDFQDKLMNVPDPTYDSLKWYVENALKTATPMGKTLYNEEVWVGDEFTIPLNSLTASRPEIAYMAFDKNGNLISFATFNPYNCPNGDYSIGGRVGNSEISSFGSIYFQGMVTSQVYIDKYMYDIVNECAGTDDAIVYSLDRTFCTSSCGQDKWDCPEAEGYNPYSCVAGGKTQLGCSGSTNVAASNGTTTFSDSIDGKSPVDLLTTKFQIKVDATVRYPEYWIERSASATSPDISAGC